jgi:hypothetical protein
MYPEMVVSMMIFRAEQEIRNAKIERRRLAVEAGTWSVRQRPAWTALRRHAGDALVALGERLRGTTLPAAAPLDPAAA